jgi:hypothetical protein
MAHQPMSRWERMLRKIGMNLIDGIRNIFGSSTPVAYRPPDPEPKREGSSHHGDHAHTSPRSNTGDRLSPRERRGRD